MVRIGISVEGATEERFIKMSLVPHLAKQGIFVTPVSMGGNVSVDRVRHEINQLIYHFDIVTTFYDFYGFKRKQKRETKESLEAQILESVPKTMRGKMIPYIQMYEFEGLLFSSPSAIAFVLQQDEIEPWAQAILRQFNGNPELINNSSQTAPSKRLASTPYRKTTHGPNIAKEIGLEVLRKKCKGFDDWLSRLEALTE
ncbi:MAG: hypothetical protein DRR16_29185 [Candidatus Parabeggiatoa sp. nov. 3]|nr:MAG: hypothetical protein DRR00_28285 [Gammaproteobacteria bacterium]RKZ57854.1 MAG: hypothetical protein DRQ99_26295 [Gammaproteobacteria bacterium]RKZ77684.1 MAG: hypothetical protein DRR16_29185 [Gammaproteobacteria bacterium]